MNVPYNQGSDTARFIGRRTKNKDAPAMPVKEGKRHAGGPRLPAVSEESGSEVQPADLSSVLRGILKIQTERPSVFLRPG